jgi:hypothetical protein
MVLKEARTIARRAFPNSKRMLATSSDSSFPHERSESTNRGSVTKDRVRKKSHASSRESILSQKDMERSS